jgi:superfamily I DNA/RNA helicase
MEDVNHQLLMVTFSRAAATEFKKRLLKLIGYAVNFIEIKPFIPIASTYWGEWEPLKNQVKSLKSG